MALLPLIVRIFSRIDFSVFLSSSFSVLPVAARATFAVVADAKAKATAAGKVTFDSVRLDKSNVSRMASATRVVAGFGVAGDAFRVNVVAFVFAEC